MALDDYTELALRLRVYIANYRDISTKCSSLDSKTDNAMETACSLILSHAVTSALDETLDMFHQGLMLLRSSCEHAAELASVIAGTAQFSKTVKQTDIRLLREAMSTAEQRLVTVFGDYISFDEISMLWLEYDQGLQEHMHTGQYVAGYIDTDSLKPPTRRSASLLYKLLHDELYSSGWHAGHCHSNFINNNKYVRKCLDDLEELGHTANKV